MKGIILVVNGYSAEDARSDDCTRAYTHSTGKTRKTLTATFDLIVAAVSSSRAKPRRTQMHRGFVFLGAQQ